MPAAKPLLSDRHVSGMIDSLRRESAPRGESSTKGLITHRTANTYLFQLLFDRVYSRKTRSSCRFATEGFATGFCDTAIGILWLNEIA